MKPTLPLLKISQSDLPDHAALAALRAWYAGLPTREAVIRYLPESVWQGHSARRVMSEIRRQLIRCALARRCDDLATLFAQRTAERVKQARQVAQAIQALRIASVATRRSPMRFSAGCPHASRARCSTTASRRSPTDAADSASPAMVDGCAQARPGTCAPNRGVLCGPPGAHRTGSRAHQVHRTSDRGAVGQRVA